MVGQALHRSRAGRTQLWAHTRANGTAIPISGSAELGLQPQKRPSKAQPARPLNQASMRGAPPEKLPMGAQASELISKANRGNALRSTGPKTEAGKRRSRRNAVRHGLTAETVVVALEDIEDYQALEAAIIADYDAESARGARVDAPACIAVVAHGVVPPPLRLISFRSRPKIPERSPV